MAIRAYNRCAPRLIPRSWLQERSWERGDYVVRGGRLLSVLSRRRDLQKPNSMEVLPAFRGRGADRRWGFGASYGSKVREETGRLSPPQSVTAFRLSSMVIGPRSIKTYFKSNYSDRNLEKLDRQITIRDTVQSPLNLI